MDCFSATPSLSTAPHREAVISRHSLKYFSNLLLTGASPVTLKLTLHKLIDHRAADLFGIAGTLRKESAT